MVKIKRGKRNKHHSIKKWSAPVTANSNALDLEAGVFTWRDPKRIAESLKRSAEESTRRKAKPFQSAMSMLNFYINRAGSNLTSKQKRKLENAKSELRKLFNRTEKNQMKTWRFFNLTFY